MASIGGVIRYIFIPLGFGDDWAAPVAAITGLVAKEVVVATFASIGNSVPILFSQVTAFAFMIFTLFAAPCAAAIGAMKKEFGTWKMTGFAVCFQTGLAYILALLVNLIGNAVLRGTSAVQTIVFDVNLMERASEGEVMSVDIVLIIFAALIVIGLIVGIANRYSSNRDYNMNEVKVK